MNFWKRYPADYGRKTARLTLAQHGAYTLLLDELYTSEHPLPGDEESLFRICRAMTQPEREAVRFVVDFFFELGADDRLHNKRAAEELKEAAPAIEAARNNGKRGGRPKKETQQKPTGLSEPNPAETQGEPKSKPPHSSELREETRTEAIASAAEAAQQAGPDAIYALGLPLLTAASIPEKQARAFLGFLRKHNTDAEVARAIDRCAKTRALEPITFLQGCLKTGAKHVNRQEAIEADGKRVAEEWLKETA